MIPRGVKNAVSLFSWLGGDLVVFKSHPIKDEGMLKDFVKNSEDDAIENGAWFMIQHDEEDWVYAYIDGADQSVVSNIRRALNKCKDDDDCRFSVLSDKISKLNVWRVDAQWDSKRLYLNVTAPDDGGKVEYIFSIKHDVGEGNWIDEAISDVDRFQQHNELDQICLKNVRKQHQKWLAMRAKPAPDAKNLHAMYHWEEETA